MILNDEDFNKERIDKIWETMILRLPEETSEKIFDAKIYEAKDWGLDLWGAIVYQKHFIHPLDLVQFINQNKKPPLFKSEQNCKFNYGWTYVDINNPQKALHWMNASEITYDKEGWGKLLCIKARAYKNLLNQPSKNIQEVLSRNFNNLFFDYFKRKCGDVSFEPITKEEYEKLDNELNNS